MRRVFVRGACFGRFAGTRGRSLVLSRFQSYKSRFVRRSSLLVFRHPRSLVRRDIALRLSRVIVFSVLIFVFVSCYFVLPSRFLGPFPFLVCRVVLRERISEGSIVVFLVSVFVRLLASCEVAFVGPFVDPRFCSVFRIRS